MERKSLAGIVLNLHLLFFLRDISDFLKALLRHFPVSPFRVYLDEVLRAKEV
jgi:hypothetical protein